MPDARWLAIACAACSSSASQSPQPPAPVAVHAPPTCEALPPPAPPAAGDDVDAPTQPRRGGMFGLDGLEPRETPTRGATCQAARSTLDTANTAILGAPAGAAIARHTAWDRRTDPARWGRVAQRLGLGAKERAMLGKQGFAVAAGMTFWTYVEAYHEVFQSQLPIFVSTDSIMHAIFTSHGAIVDDVERELFRPRVERLLAAMHCWLPAGAKAWPRDVARDVDLYLTVARSLLADKPVRSVFGIDGAASPLVGHAKEAKGLREIVLFGRRRHVDFSQFEPRGHYRSDEAQTYFRAMTWLSRIELNLVSRSSRSSTLVADPTETPHEVAIALALADAAKGAGVAGDLAELDGAWDALVGPREDVSLAQLDRLRAAAGIDRVSPDAQPALARAIGGGFRRSMPTQVHPDGETELPVIAAMFGARVVADTAALAPIVQPAVPGRIAVSAADMGYLLGHDRATAHLASELVKFPNLAGKLGDGRRALDARSTGTDLYSSWLRAIRAIAREPAGTVPAFMTTDAYADLKLSSAITAFGQLRHAHVLMAGMAYLGSGCEIPDGFVEPAAAVYDALIEYADRGAAVFAKLDPDDRAKTATYWKRLRTTLGVLRAIVATELANRPLTEAQRRWLSMVVEIVVDNSGSGAPPTYAGWYFDLFRNFSDATADPDFVADYAWNGEATAPTAMYIGAGDPRMGVFVVDTGGPPRVVTGPIASSFELSHPTANGRLADGDPLDPGSLHAPWSASHTIPPAPKPPLTVGEEWRGSVRVFVAEAKTRIGPVTLEWLDHHRVPLASVTHVVGPGTTVFRLPDRRGAEMLHLRQGEFHAWTVPRTDAGMGFWFVDDEAQPPVGP